MRCSQWLYIAILSCPVAIFAEEPDVILGEMKHLRIEGSREWSDFPETPDGHHLEIDFSAKENSALWCLRIRQQDVKELWHVSLNGQRLGQLVRDENDAMTYFDVPIGLVKTGRNVLRVEQEARRNGVPDDVRVGEMALYFVSREQVLNESAVEIEVLEAETKSPLPARLTIVRTDGALETTGAKSNQHLAVRCGTVYTANGQARFGLPGGEYVIYAGRGFEYSLDSTKVRLVAGETKRFTLSIRREVPTEGYVACDTHVHTLTHSGHGDATVHERMITLAAEGIELPIATDHNVHVDHDSFARQAQVRQYFTPVIGNEVTTPVGHFNVFPVRAGAKPPEFKLREWSQILDGIYRTPGVKVAILNHARDVHSGVRPFGPKLFNAAVGENVQGGAMRFNAMEVINSSANQTDPLCLFHDWMALLNRGEVITPVGGSDSHDVLRHFVGQGRTYVRCDDRDPGNIDVEAAVNNFLQGRVRVSYGLLSELTVNGKYHSGELALVPDDEMTVSIRILGPHWVSAERVVLFANGTLLREEEIPRNPKNLGRELPTGVIFQSDWTFPKPAYDVHLVAIAMGPGIDKPYWKTAKPYQPKSPDWVPQFIGCSGAVWLDCDADGQFTSARDYARELVADGKGSLPALMLRLAEYDEAVSAQAAHWLQSNGTSPMSQETQQALKTAKRHVQLGFQHYVAAWRQNQIARSEE